MDKKLVLQKIKKKLEGKEVDEKSIDFIKTSEKVSKVAITKMAELIGEVVCENIKDFKEEEFIMFKDGKFQNFPLKDYIIQNKGDKGDKGFQGEASEHEWNGTKLRFKDKIGIWGKFINLKGEKGDKGDTVIGKRGLTGFTGSQGEQGKSVNEKKLEDRLLQSLINRLDGKIDEEMPKKEKKILDKLHQKLIEMVQKLQVHGGGLSRADILDLISGNTGNVTRVDLSAQCDGANMVFTLPDNFVSGTVALWSTQFPIVYRPIVDYTETAANQITLVAAEVGAPQAGQTLVALYER